jgi:hypothetical protein
MDLPGGHFSCQQIIVILQLLRWRDDDSSASEVVFGKLAVWLRGEMDPPGGHFSCQQVIMINDLPAKQYRGCERIHVQTHHVVKRTSW